MAVCSASQNRNSVNEHKCSAEVTLSLRWQCVARSQTRNFVNEHKCSAEVTLSHRLHCVVRSQTRNSVIEHKISAEVALPCDVSGSEDVTTSRPQVTCTLHSLSSSA